MFSLNPALKLMRCLLAENLANFPTDDDCLNMLRNYFEEKCNNCGGKNLLREVGRRDAKCLDCNKKTWLTARTFLNSIKRPRAYLMAFTLIQRGIEFSGAEFARLVDIAPSSAQHVIKKISFAVVAHLLKHGVDTKSSDFAPCIFSRSIDSPANEHPHAEFEELERRHSAQSNQTKAILDSLSQTEITIYELFEDQPLGLPALEVKSGLPTNQVLTALAMLEVEGLIETTNGTDYVKCRQQVAPPPVSKPSRLTRRYVAKSLRLIKRTHKSVSRKYLQLYLAFYWCLLDQKWNAENLLRVCVKHGPVSASCIKNYVSPYMVHVCRFV